MTLSPWLTMIWLGENANDLKSHAPTLLGSVILNPPPVGIVEFSGGFSAGCVGPFCMQVSHFIPALIFVIPSQCTVFIQNSLVVDLGGLTTTVAEVSFELVVELFVAEEIFLYSLADSAFEPLSICPLAYCCRLCILMLPDITLVIIAIDNIAIIDVVVVVVFEFVFIFIFLIRFIILFSFK